MAERPNDDGWSCLGCAVYFFLVPAAAAVVAGVIPGLFGWEGSWWLNFLLFAGVGLALDFGLSALNGRRDTPNSRRLRRRPRDVTGADGDRSYTD